MRFSLIFNMVLKVRFLWKTALQSNTESWFSAGQPKIFTLNLIPYALDWFRLFECRNNTSSTQYYVSFWKLLHFSVACNRWAFILNWKKCDLPIFRSKIIQLCIWIFGLFSERTSFEQCLFMCAPVLSLYRLIINL